MRKTKQNWKVATWRGMAALMAAVTVFHVGPASSAPADIFENPAPVLASEPGKAAPIADGDTSVSSQTGALNYSFPISVPPGPLAPHLSLTYSSQAPTYGGIASGWAWNLSIPEIREDASAGRMRTHHPNVEALQADPKLDDRFVSSMAGGRPLVMVAEPGDPAAYQYRAQNDTSFARYERMKAPLTAGYSWRVYTTDGVTRYFGQTSATLGCVNVSEGFAPLTREVNEFGWEATYQYESIVPGECRIKSIKYGQNTGASVLAFAQVDFLYSPDLALCGGIPVGSVLDYRTGKKIVTGASRLSSIKATAFLPGGSPASAVHTRTIALGYDGSKETCTLQHAPVRQLISITESAVGVDSPLVTLPPKTFTYNSPATTLVAPAAGEAVPWLTTTELTLRRSSLAWGRRYTDERWPSVEAMMLDVDGDGLIDRVFNTSGFNSSGVYNCSASWAKNMGRNPATGALLSFVLQPNPIILPHLKWHGPGLAFNTVAGATAPGADNHEGCSLNGAATNYRNSQGVGTQTANSCHDATSCSAATNPLDTAKYCNVNETNKGTACPPRGGPDDLKLTYLAYRWMDVTGDGLVDLVTAVHGSSNFYDIERGNLKAGMQGQPDDFTGGEPSMFGIPGVGAWPPCAPAAAVERCANTGAIPNEYLQNCDQSGVCQPNWPAISTAVSSAPQVGCGSVMARPAGSGGGGGGAPSRAPYERCQGLYPWIIYPNLGNGTFASTPSIKYQPLPLESDSGDSSFGGPAIASTNHAIQDIDGDGVLDAIVHFDEHILGGTPNEWQVWLGDRTGQFGPKMYMFPTRANPANTLAGLGQLNADISESSTGLTDFNGDGLPDHWRNDGNNNVNVALNNGTNLELNATLTGQINTPMVLAAGVAKGVKPGADATYSLTIPHSIGTIKTGTASSKNRPVDVDGDGRVDVVRWNSGSPQVFWNYGGQLASSGVTYPGDTAGDERRVEAIEEVPDLFWELRADLVDLDGDGRSESASFPATGPGDLWRATPPSAQPPRLMSAISNGRGATTQVTYGSMHDGTVTQDASIVVNGRPKASPTNQWVVKSLTSTDSFTAGSAITTYAYKYPAHLKDDEGRYAFRGFEQVTTTSPSGSRTVQRYTYAPDWSGRLSATVVMPKLGSGEGDNDARSIDLTTWEERQLFGGAIKTYHATVSEHFTCKNGQGDPTDPYAPPPAVSCTASTAGGYTRTTSTLTPLGSGTSGNLTPLLWQETESLLQAQVAPTDGDRKTKSTFQLHANASTYRLRPTASLKTVRVAGVETNFGRTQTTWDPTYRVPVQDELWFNTNDLDRAITTRTFDMQTGNLLQETDPRNNSIGYEYDIRKHFVAAENQVFTHNFEYEYEPGTGTKLVTRGPQVAQCSLASPSTCPGQLARNENRIRVDGLGRMIERFASVNPSATLDYFELRKVETNTYVDTPSGTIPTSVTHQSAIKETSPGVILYVQDKTELDGHGRPTTKIVFANGAAAADQVTTFQYNPEGTLNWVSVPDPRVDTTATVRYRYTFDSLGRTKTIRRPDNPLASASGVDMDYDGVVTTATEVVGTLGGVPAVTKTTNDGFGRLVRVDEKKDAIKAWALTFYAYDPNDNVSQITDPEGKVTQLAHDYASRRTAISRINGGTTKTWSYGYDKNGNMVSETVPCTGTDCGVFAYTTTTAYDAFNHPTSKVLAKRALSVPDRALFGADAETMIWDTGSNGRGQLVEWRSFGGGTEAQLQRRTFDPDGRSKSNWQSFTRGGFNLSRSIQYGYHLGGARKQTSYGDFVNGGSVQTTSTVDLDARGLPSTVSVAMTAPCVGCLSSATVTHTRNVAGLVTKRSGTLASSAKVDSLWTYDALGRVTNQTVQKVAVPNIITAIARQTLTYNGNDDPSTLVHALGSASKTFTYTYDVRHQLMSVASNVAGFFNAAYAYGPAGRFTGALEARTVTPPAVTDLQTRDVSYVYGGADAEQVTALTNTVGGARFATFTYDDAGNMLTRCMGATFTPTCAGELLEYLYDGKDQLRRVTRKLNNVVTGSEEYWYDSAGNRTQVRKLNASGAVTELVWYLDDTEHHITPGSPAVEVRAFAHVTVGTPVARIERTGDTTAPLEYQFHGLASSTLAAVAQTGTVNASFMYAPFGELLDGTGTTTSLATHTRRFNDKVQDELTALTYYGARYYDKVLIGWTQADPLYRFVPDSAWENPRRAACYMFSGQNPLRYVDPDGRSFGRYVMQLAHEAAPDKFADPGAPGKAESAMDRGLEMVAASSNPISGAVSQATNGSLMDTINDAAVAAFVPPELGRADDDIPDFLEGKVAPNSSGGGSGAGSSRSKPAPEASKQEYVGKLPKPPKGPGAVPESKRDPQRRFGDGARQEKRREQNNQCATGCGTRINRKNSRGHHIKRWADGGKTRRENHAEVCVRCHKKLHE